MILRLLACEQCHSNSGRDFVINSLDSLIRLYTDNLRNDVTAVRRKNTNDGGYCWWAGAVISTDTLKLNGLSCWLLACMAIYLLLFKRRKELIKSWQCRPELRDGV